MSQRPLWISFLALVLLAAAPASAQYSRTQRSPDGTGIVYMGREIAQVMGHLGADWLERPERVREERPDIVVSGMQLKPGDVVADIGAGTGYFSIRIAKAVPQGRVLAVDIQPEMVALLKANMDRQGVANIDSILSTNSDPRLPVGAVDKVLMVDAYHEFDQPREMLEGIVRGLKPDGEVIFVEYRGEDESVPILPHHKMTVAQLSREMAAVGLRLVRRVDGLPWQHMLVYRR
jgi:precorrin-6B methylase 2